MQNQSNQNTNHSCNNTMFIETKDIYYGVDNNMKAYGLCNERWSECDSPLVFNQHVIGLTVYAASNLYKIMAINKIKMTD